MKKWLERLMKQLKEEKGLTLIELLAVIVILGIIAAIAVPSITGITGSTKKEAHKANARQMVEAAKQMVAINGYVDDHTADTNWTGYKTVTSAGAIKTDSDTTTTKDVMEITLAEMIAANYFTAIKNPETDTNYSDKADSAKKNAVYVVKNSGKYEFYVQLEDVTGWGSPLIETQIDNLKLQ